MREVFDGIKESPHPEKAAEAAVSQDAPRFSTLKLNCVTRFRLALTSRLAGPTSLAGRGLG